MAVAEAATQEHRGNPRHPAKVREFCRRLYQDYDRTPEEIRRILAERGYSPLPGWSTIRSWGDPEYRHRRLSRARRRHAQRRGAALKTRSPKRGWHYRLERIQEMRSLGISYRAIAVLASHDWDLDLTEGRVECLLKGTPREFTVKRLLWPEAESV